MKPKRPRTEKQLANDQRLKEAAAARRANPSTAPKLHPPVRLEAPATPVEPARPVDLQPSQDVDVQTTQLDAMQKQLNEVMETNALLKAALLNNQNAAPNQPTDNVQVGRGNKVLGEIDKYLVDPNAYPDPTPRLADEKRLQGVNFKHDYDLEYEFKVSSYETKTGLNMREPDFLITLYRIVYDNQGEPVLMVDPKTNKLGVKRYIARRLSFKEDPQAALVIARENNLDIDKTDEKTYLNEMRYLRVRDWLFDVFWPKPTTGNSAVLEEAIGGSIVQISVRSSLDASSPDFDALGDSKLQV